jgi:uncharacterized protein (DUF924 family)
MECEPVQWFTVDRSFDDEITDRFSVTYDMGCEGLNDHWAEDADGALSLCLLFDQFPRHMFRGTPRIFATDDRALKIAKQAIARGFDQVLPHEQKFFLYLPFEHSEDAADQKRNLELFKAMAPQNPIAYAVAQQRYEVFNRFGRFPERNELLGRQSTPEEKQYLSSIKGSPKL